MGCFIINMFNERFVTQCTQWIKLSKLKKKTQNNQKF